MKKQIVLVALVLSSSASQAVSFNCARGSTFVEKTICSNPLLNKLDDALSDNYKYMLASDIGSGAKKNLRVAQKKWLAERNKCEHAKCLVDAYSKRIDEICEYPVLSGVHPVCIESDTVAANDANEEPQTADRVAPVDSEKANQKLTLTGVSDEQIIALSGEMYRSYLGGGLDGMLRHENSCWGKSAGQVRINKNSAAVCTASAFAGLVIEATYARQQGRVPVPAYNGTLFAQRILKNITKAGIKEDQAKLLVGYMLERMETTIYGLMLAGMR